MEKKLVIKKAIAAIKSAADAFTASVDKATSTITTVVVKHIKELKAAKATNKEIHATVHAAIGDACTPQNINKILLANDVRQRAKRSDKNKGKPAKKNGKPADKSSTSNGITTAQIVQLIQNAPADVRVELANDAVIGEILNESAAAKKAAA